MGPSVAAEDPPVEGRHSSDEEPDSPQSSEEPDSPHSGDSPSEGEGADARSDSKKKRKKKKKKAGGAAAAAAGGGGGGAQPPVDPAARKQGERRFQEAVEQLAHNSEDALWVKLGGCHLADAKLKRLCEALRANTTVISIDLSANQLTDEGAKALAAALQDGRAPDLIDLDLQDNPIDEAGAQALEALQAHRKTLRVALGASQPPAPPSQQQQQQQAGGGAPQGRPPLTRQLTPRPGGGGGQQQQQGAQQGAQQQQQQQNGDGGGADLAESIKNNPVISKYFSVGNDDAEDAPEEPEQAGGAGGGQEEEGAAGFGGLTEAELAQILWDQLEQCLDAPRPSIPAVSEPLRAIAEQVEHEMDNAQLPLPPTVEVGDLRTFSQWALRKLHVLHSVLDLVPPPLLTPYSKQTPVPAVGTHRAAVAELLAQLLRSEAPCVAQHVAASGVLRRCAKVAVQHPNCSAIHGAVGRCLRLSLSSRVGQAGLWHQLLGSAPVAAHGGAISEDRGASLNLAVEAARIAAEARQAPTIGKRPANVGFALAIGQLLHAAATGERLGAGSEAPAGASRGSAGSPGGSPGSAAEGGGGAAASDPLEGANPLKEKPLPPGFKLPRIPSASSIPLAASGTAVSDLPAEDEGWERQLTAQLATEDAWVQFSAGPDCLLRGLLAEHVGDLGGPRPRPGAGPAADDEEEEEAPTGQIISGQELLMMLRGLNLGGGFSGM